MRVNSVLLQLQPSDELVAACGSDPGWVCRQVFEQTGSETMASVADFLVGAPARILMVVAVAAVVSRLVQRGISRLTDRVRDVASTGRLGPTGDPRPLLAGAAGPRASARASTVASVLRSVSSIVIWAMAAVTILGELGLNLGPIIASAGIAGVAIGFGAQSLVKDFLSGVFMIAEDQYGVGDIVDVGEATGTIEAVTLRTTRLRDVNGTVWHVPNGQIARVGNKSQEWARALLDVSVAYDTDLRRAEEVIKQVADNMGHDRAWKGKLLEEPQVWGVENLAADGIDIRLVIKTQPAEQFTVMRELRKRLKEALDGAGIEIPFPQRTIWVRNGGEGAGPGPEGNGNGNGPAPEHATIDVGARDRSGSAPARVDNEPARRHGRPPAGISARHSKAAPAPAGPAASSSPGAGRPDKPKLVPPDRRPSGPERPSL